jgi:hypothetical protein
MSDQNRIKILQESKERQVGQTWWGQLISEFLDTKLGSAPDHFGKDVREEEAPAGVERGALSRRSG